MKLHGRILAAFLIILLLAGCGGSGPVGNTGSPPADSPGNTAPPSPSPSPTPSPLLQTLSVDPPVAATVTGGIETFTAVGRYSDGSERDLTGDAVWTSSDPAVTVSNVPGEHGFATAHAPHPGLTVRATVSGLTASATMSVDPHTLVSIAVWPVATRLAKGTRGRLRAVALYSDGSHVDVTGIAAWTSAAPTIATVDSRGEATAVSVGQAAIRASLGGISSSATVTVTAAALTTLQVTPRIASVAKGTSLQFTATGVFSDRSTQDLTEMATWTSGDPAVSVSPSGLATGLGAASEVAVTAAVGAVSDSASLTVTPAFLVSLQVDPPAATIALGTNLQFHATGTFSDESVQDLTDSVNWTSSDPTVAVVRSGGLASSESVGSAAITATLGPVSGVAHLSVSNATLVSISISPATPVAARGTSIQLTATGTFTDGSTQDLTESVTWSSASAAVQISNVPGTHGLAYAAEVASNVEVAATLDEIRATSQMSVSPAVLISISVKPHSVTIPKGVSQPLTATGNYSDGTTQDLTALAAWSSSAPGVATVDARGSVTGTGVGQAFVTAAFGDVADVASVDVTPAVLRSIAVTPASTSVRVLQRVQYRAVGAWSDGAQKDVTNQVVWTTSMPAAAQISNVLGSRGLCEGLAAAAGITVRASLAGVHGEAALTVTVAPRILYGMGQTGFLRPMQISVLTGNGGILAPAFRTPFNTLQAGNTSAMATADGRFVYSTTSLLFDRLGFIGGVSVNRTTGAFTELPGFRIDSPTGNGALAVAGSPDGRYVYVAVYSDASRVKYAIYSYEVTETGALRRTGIPVSCTDRPSAMNVDRQGRFLFVPSEEGGNVHVYLCFPDGSMEEVRSSPFAILSPGDGPRKCVVDPTGRYLYCVSKSLIGGMRISATGALEKIPPFVSYYSPFDIAMHPSGRYFFIKASQAPFFSRFATVRIAEGGACHVASSGGYVDGINPPYGLAADPVGDYAYNAEAGRIAQFRMLGDGKFEELPDSPISVNGEYVAPHTLLVIP